VRLAFAVAAHLEPEIMIVDEVLAVGDAGFQKKCLGKMGEVAGQGRTVLFVSHNMAAVNRLCGHAVLLNGGEILALGVTEEVVDTYLHSRAEKESEYRCADPDSAHGDEDICLRAARILDSDGIPSSKIDILKPFFFEIEYEILTVITNLRIGFRMVTSDGTVVFTTSDTEASDSFGRTRQPGRYVNRCQIPGNLMNEGRYSLLNLWADIPFVKVKFLVENVLPFQIERTGGPGARYPERWTGVICPSLSWQILQLKG